MSKSFVPEEEKTYNITHLCHMQAWLRLDRHSFSVSSFHSRTLLQATLALSLVVSLLCLCSGVILSRGSSSAAPAISELTAFSGSAYLYFYSDAAVNMSGFSIRYRFVMLFRIPAGPAES